MNVIRKITNIIIVASTLLMSETLLANSIEKVDATNLDFGIGYKAYSIALPSKISSSEQDAFNQFPALAFIVSDDFNEYLSLNFEVSKGLSNASSGYDFVLQGTDMSETYTAELDYSLSITGKFRLLANSLLRPYLLLGGNASAISYDYQEKTADVTTDEESDTFTSTGLIYGAGLELITDHNLKLSLTYEMISHFKYDTDALSFEATFEF